MDPEKREVLERQGYRIVGEHSGVKLCHWTKASLTKGIGCYKQTFYGIESHRCLQMTPAVDACNLACQFCWRTQEWGSDSLRVADDPSFIVDDSIRGQRELLSGFKGNPNVSTERVLEAWHPRNVAISLTGEPTLYKRLGEMIDEFKRRKMSTFLVTNGTTPSVLRRMHAEGRLPTQLYVTVAAPNEGIYRKLVAAKSDHEWKKLKETLALLPTLATRTVIRHTLVEGWNLGWEDEYAELDRIGRPMFIECKGYSFVGESRLRLEANNVPSHASIRRFAEGLADRIGYQVAAEREDSRVVLLTTDGQLHPILHRTNSRRRLLLPTPDTTTRTRGRPHPGPERRVQHAVALHAPGVRLRRIGRAHPADSNRDCAPPAADRWPVGLPDRHRPRHRGGQDGRRVADLPPRPEPRRIRPEVVRPLARGTMVRRQGGEVRRSDRIYRPVLAPQRPDDERHDSDLRLLGLQRRGQGA